MCANTPALSCQGDDRCVAYTASENSVGTNSSCPRGISLGETPFTHHLPFLELTSQSATWAARLAFQMNLYLAP